MQQPRRADRFRSRQGCELFVLLEGGKEKDGATAALENNPCLCQVVAVKLSTHCGLFDNCEELSHIIERTT
jgi:hypothetical protein